MSRILGIDPGTFCGWAVLGLAGERVASGQWNLSRRRVDGAGMLYVRLERELLTLLDAQRPDVLVYEQVMRHAGTDAAHIYGGIVGTIQRVCELRSLPYTGALVTHVKLRATGSGAAKKDAMISAAARHWALPYTPTDNEADALWVAETYRNPPPVPPKKSKKRSA